MINTRGSDQKTFPRSLFLLFSTLLLLILMTGTCSAYFRVLKVGNSPVSISIEQRKYEEGVIRKAFLRTPLEILSLKELEGFRLEDQYHGRQKLDHDDILDLAWEIALEKPDTGEKYRLWVVTLSQSARGWIFLTPYGENLWERLPFVIDAPEDVILHFSSTTPGYNGTPPLKGRNIMTFVYTLSFTEEGPRLVIAPEVYRTVHRIASMVAAEETDPKVKFTYEMMCSDFARMALGKMPSRDAVITFSWQQIINFPLEK